MHVNATSQGLQTLSTVHSVALEGSGTFHSAKFWSPHMKRDANWQPVSGGLVLVERVPQVGRKDLGRSSCGHGLSLALSRLLRWNKGECVELTRRLIPPVLVYHGCHNKTPHMGCLKRQEFIPHGSGGQKSTMKVSTRPLSLEVSLLGWQMATWSLCPHSALSPVS